MIKSKLLLAAGLLLTAGAFMLARYAFVPDFVRGAMMGVGLGVEVLSLGMMQKREKVCARS